MSLAKKDRDHKVRENVNTRENEWLRMNARKEEITL